MYHLRIYKFLHLLNYILEHIIGTEFRIIFALNRKLEKHIGGDINYLGFSLSDVLIIIYNTKTIIKV